MFIGLHATAAMLTKTPELAITEAEGRDFLKAAQNVARHYSVQTTQKSLDWIAFIGAAAGMYGTRAFAISMRKGQEKAAAQAERGTVLRFPDRGRRHAEPEPAPAPVPEAPAGAPPDYFPSVIPGEADELTGF